MNTVLRSALGRIGRAHTRLDVVGSYKKDKIGDDMDFRGRTCKTCGKKFHYCTNCGLWPEEAFPLIRGYCSWECVPDEVKQEFDNETNEEE